MLFIILVCPDFLSVLFFLGLCKFQSFHLLQVLFFGVQTPVKCDEAGGPLWHFRNVGLVHTTMKAGFHQTFSNEVGSTYLV